ncbi:hypothetical protein ES705_31828 [subsurface metagenome]
MEILVDHEISYVRIDGELVKRTSAEQKKVKKKRSTKFKLKVQ